MSARRAFVLPDVLAPSLRLVFCGTAAGRVSAERGAYYAHPGNRFWRTLHEVGLTPTRFRPEDFREVLPLGIGLTDLAKFVFGNDDELPFGSFDRSSLERKLLRYAPRVVAFTSKNAARSFLERDVRYGLEEARIGTTSIYVLPSPSGQATRFFDIALWQGLADLVRVT